MKFRPIYDRVLVFPVNPEEKIGSIIVPDNAQSERSIGCVMAVGPGAIQNDGAIRPMTIRVGEVVIFQTYSGFEVELETGLTGPDEPRKLKYKVIQEEEILGVLEEEEPTDESH